MICLKIRTFVVSATTLLLWPWAFLMLWFAWKFVPLWYQQQQILYRHSCLSVVICLKIRTFVVSATTSEHCINGILALWFAWKFVPLWYQQQPKCVNFGRWHCCDLLENSYLCGISNNIIALAVTRIRVVICLKIRTFVVSATTTHDNTMFFYMLWFAWKFVPLWYQQQPLATDKSDSLSCDLLENSYLCGISNNLQGIILIVHSVVICLKIRTFVVSATTTEGVRDASK